MTVHQRNEETAESTFPIVTPSDKNTWPEMENDSSSWDRNSRATSSSWPGDMEEAATRKILQLWETVEKNLYDEIDVETSDVVANECDQWRKQLTHLRIVGKTATTPSLENSNESSIEIGTARSNVDDRDVVDDDEPTIDDLSRANNSQGHPNSSLKRFNLTDNVNQIFDRIIDYATSELSHRQREKNVVSLTTDLDDVLRITPAPISTNDKKIGARKKRYSADIRKKIGTQENRSDATGRTIVDVPRETERRFSASSRKPRENSGEDEVIVAGSESEVLPVARNKLGTVFNEKIVVSPVPFVVSHRESFTTLRTTPISFRGQTFENSTSQGFGRCMNSACRTNSGQRISGFRTLQSHSAWQVPVCPTVWPKNIRLAPIDPARLPSSKNRSSFDSPAVPQRNRNSLSPISRLPKPSVASASLKDNNGEGLEIQGKQIATRSRKHNQLKSGTPRNAKSSRTKIRGQNR